MFGFVYSLIVAIVGLVVNIVIYNSVTDTDAVIIFCVVIMVVAAIGWIICVVRYRKHKDNQTINLKCMGILLSVVTIIITVIFLIVDIKSLNELSYVGIHS